MTTSRYTLLAVCALLISIPVQAQETKSATPDMAIAAVVGDHAISSYDTENRIRFIMSTTRLSNTPDVIKHIRPQVIRSLIDEQLQLQEAQKNGIEVKEQEIKDAVAVIENQRNMKPGAIAEMLTRNKIPEDIFMVQIRAQLAWGKLLTKKIRPQVKISDEEIELARQRFLAPAVKQELEISVLALPVDKESREDEVRRLGEKLVKEMRTGASFEEVSRQFSGNAPGGTFWVRPEELDKGVARALAGARKGTIIDPVRTEQGFTIVKVYNTRSLEVEKPKDIEVELKEILLRLKSDSDRKEADVLLAIGEEVAKNPGTCEEKGIASIDNLQDFDIDVNFRKDTLAKLPSALKIIAENLKIGEISTPFASSEGIRLYMLCSKKEAELDPVDRTRVANMLVQQKMELEAQKYMRNLRRDAFIEIRN